MSKHSTTTRATRSGLGFYAIPLAIIALAAWYVSRPESPAPPPGEPHGYALSAPLSPGGSASSTRRPSATPRPQVNPERPALRALPPPPSLAGIRSPIADSLHAPTSSGVQDLAIIYSLLDHYREAFGSFPTGEDNATVVNALTGNNPHRLAFIDRTHPAINARGELTDRWQTPLFFHMESRDAIELRSAGPDREMYSGDDLRHASPALRAAR